MNPVNTKLEVPNQIRHIRSLRGMSSKSVATALGQKTTTQICLWERGRKAPTLVNALRLAIILQVSVEQLFRQLVMELEQKLHPNPPSNND